MDIVERIKDILSTDSSVIVNKTHLSYIDKLFPQFKNYIVIHKKGKKFSDDDANVIVPDDYDIDITGNPLEYSFGDDKFNDTSLIMESYWSQEDELYFPFSRVEACTILNICREYLDDDYTTPLFVLCNGKDPDKTVILGCIIEKNWLNTIEVTNGETQRLDTLKNISSKLLSDHLKLSFSQPYDVSISSLNIYNLFVSKHATLKLSENEKPYFKGNVILNMTVNNIVFDPPTRSSNNNLVLDIITGTDDSVLTSLWHQLLLLNQFLMVLDTYKEMNSKAPNRPISIQFPNDFVNPCAKGQAIAMENINNLLMNDLTYRTYKYDKMEEMYMESDESSIKLEQYIKAAFFRPNLDFTDLLWESLICIPEYAEMIKSMHEIFEKIMTSECQLQLNMTDNTNFAKILAELPRQGTDLHLLVRSLEILINIGFEKLSRDYKYILINLGFVTFNDIRFTFGKSPEKFNSDFYRKQLVNMVHIHITLEFMLLLQTHLNCLTRDLESSFEYVLKQMTCVQFPIKALQELHKHKIYTLTIPASNVLTDELTKGVPAIWRVDLFSESKFSKTETITYFCDKPIFPPTMYHSECTNKESEVFNVTTAVINSIKVA